ncbi:DUF960 domain-containing protein [Lactiplantibacillus sp. DA1]|uniref:DUF960 domain-containing protein n=1 Tax=Lactiplantibacillus sp. DA1 TaxID=3079857 RepID=UPI00292A6386|nr:DUF960 domain-containing protein [Lactiplantibacillus sp. DA1]MDV0429897.1 DUF960 domain-containing protein [Lactiplantibacillus sp. DA1]
MFDQDEERFATLGLASKLPSAVIDGIWEIIDQNLKGVVRLPRVLQFALIARNDQVTVAFDAQHGAIMEFDLPVSYQREFPETVAVLDDGQYQTMMLLDELSV